MKQPTLKERRLYIAKKFGYVTWGEYVKSKQRHNRESITSNEHQCTGEGYCDKCGCLDCSGRKEMN